MIALSKHEIAWQRYNAELGESVVATLLDAASQPYYSCQNCYSRFPGNGTMIRCLSCRARALVRKPPSDAMVLATAAAECELLLGASSKARRESLDVTRAERADETRRRHLSDPDGITNRHEILGLMKRELSGSKRSGNRKSGRRREARRKAGGSLYDRSVLEV